MIPYLVLGVLMVMSSFVLGLVALLRARPEDLPAVVSALARWRRKQP